MKYDNNRKVLVECSFRSFYFSEFADQFVKQDGDTYIFESPKAKMIEIRDRYSGASVWDDDTMFIFYKKGPQRWVKKLEVSEQQISYGYCTVTLEGEQADEPEFIVFDMGYDKFEFPLSEEMIKELKFVYEEKIRDYFPDYPPRLY